MEPSAFDPSPMAIFRVALEGKELAGLLRRYLADISGKPISEIDVEIRTGCSPSFARSKFAREACDILLYCVNSMWELWVRSKNTGEIVGWPNEVVRVLNLIKTSVLDAACDLGLEGTLESARPFCNCRRVSTSVPDDVILEVWETRLPEIGDTLRDIRKVGPYDFHTTVVCRYPNRDVSFLPELNSDTVSNIEIAVSVLERSLQQLSTSDQLDIARAWLQQSESFQQVSFLSALAPLTQGGWRTTSDSDEMPLEPIDSAEIAILKALQQKAPLLVDLYLLESETDYSRRTIGTKLKRLIDIDYAVRPHGERKGATITELGTKCLEGLGEIIS